jgi:small membrane protein
MIVIQVILITFFLFALSRVFLRFRGGQIRATEFVFWTTVFSVAIVGVTFPSEISKLAIMLGIGRGVDLIIYASVAVLFYLVFRLYVFLEDVRHEITEVIRKIALENKQK